MISFFVGVPGSGKTYYAVDKIYNNFSNDDEAKKDKTASFGNCYTNINEFKFDKVKNAHKLDFDDLKIKLTELHKYYKDKKDDEFLVQKCKEWDILNTLFVIDEAHNFFDVKDVVLIWWLSYHRHLYHEIILITQNLSLIESKYKSFSEFFYKAFPQSLTLFKTHFKYNVYCSSRMSLNSKSGSIKIKRNKKVFELYKSGDTINAQNIILKFFGFAFLLAILLVVAVYSYSESLKSSNDVTDQGEKNLDVPLQENVSALPQQIISSSSNQINNSIMQHDSYIQQEYSSKRFFSLICNKSNCYNKSIQIPPALLELFIKDKSLNLLYSNKINENNYVFYLSCNDDFYRFISNKGPQNENSQNFGTSASSPSLFGSK